MKQQQLFRAGKLLQRLHLLSADKPEEALKNF
jgi:hypothetical protein